jgi:hypothetical protein
MPISWWSMKTVARRCSACRPAWQRRCLPPHAVSGGSLYSTCALEAVEVQLQGQCMCCASFVLHQSDCVYTK